MSQHEPENVSDVLRRHLLEPVHSGSFEVGESAAVERVNAACGDVLRLAARVEDGRIELRFLARGCWAVVAVASLLCERLSGRTAPEARALDVAAEVAAAGGLPRSRAHAVDLFGRTLGDLLDAVDRR